MVANLDFGLVGNCAYAALIDRMGQVVWCCLPRFDGDPVFCRLLDENNAHGVFAIELDRFAHSEQAYLTNTAILTTRLFDESGAGIEITDFAPRFSEYGRRVRPLILIRLVRPLEGAPKICIRVRPVFAWGAERPEITRGSNHIRYAHPTRVLRLTTNAPISYVLEERHFLLEKPIVLILGPDEILATSMMDMAREHFERTREYWRVWVRSLSIPRDWQEAVIRSAITLKLCSFEETGGIVAALTTSVPEAADTGRNWDYRFCWLRDAYFVVRALNRVCAHQTMEDYLRYLNNIVASSTDGHLQPVYGVTLEGNLEEHVVDTLPGYRGMGPVRRGNQAHAHSQHDVYGEVVLATTQAFIDTRLLKPAGCEIYERLEPLGEQAFRLYDQPDQGMWELRGRTHIHTISSVMCWAACDRLARIAIHLGLDERAEAWHAKAEKMRSVVLERAWNDRLKCFVATFEGDEVDASLLLMGEVRFVQPQDPRFTSTVAAVEKSLLRGSHMFRYAIADDFGVPRNAFNICTFWYIGCLAAVGREEEGRELLDNMLACRNHLGLLSEDLDPETGELWGNFPQTYSHVGLMDSAARLSRPWEDAL